MIGRTFTVNSGAFIASNLDPDDPGDYPYLADGVTVSTGAKILGPIVLGKGVTLGPNTVVIKSIPPHSTVLPPSSLVISKDKWKAQKPPAATSAVDHASPAQPPATDAPAAKLAVPPSPPESAPKGNPEV
jgi:serine acetyltransferase